MNFEDYKKLIKEKMSKKRFIHSVNVAKAAEQLAVKYGGDVEKAKIAGILHDITKESPYDEQLKIVSDWKFYVETLIMHNSSIRYIDEFVAEFFTNGNFVKLLNDPTIFGKRSKQLSLFDRIINWIKSLFPEGTTEVYERGSKMLEDVILNAGSSIREDRKLLKNKNVAANTIDSKTPQQLTLETINKVRDYCKTYFKFNSNEIKNEKGVVIAPAHSYSLIDKNGKVLLTTDKTASSGHYTEEGRLVFEKKIFGQDFRDYYEIPSTNLGSTVDKISRDFFDNKLKDSYPNFSKQQLDKLVEDLKKFKAWADKNDIIIMSADFPMMTTINGQVIGGTMDLIAIKPDGKIAIIDMKNKRTESKQSTLQSTYKGQQHAYKGMLEGIALN